MYDIYINKIKKDVFIKFKNYVNENKKIESIERFNNIFMIKEKNEIKNTINLIKNFVDNNSKIKNFDLLYNNLSNKILFI